MRIRVVLACAVLVPWSTWSGPAEAKPKRGDLKVTRVVVGSSPVTAGTTVRVHVTVKNTGKRVVKASKTRLFVSRDARWQKKKDPRVVTLHTVRLKKQKVAKARPGVRLPKSLAAGTYRIIACADATRLVRESNEKNNCRASAAFKVRAAKKPTPPPPPTKRYESPPESVIDEFVSAGDAFWWPASPVSIGRAESVDLDRLHSVDQDVDETGGSIDVTSAAGHVFTLSVPAGALTGRVRITATPLARLGAAQAADGLLGLALEPEGLTFLEPAELSVVPADGGVDQHAVGFTGDGDGGHTRPAEIDPDPSRLAMPIWHFSNSGILRGSIEFGFFADPEFDASPQTEAAEATRDARNDAVDGNEVDRDELAHDLADRINDQFADLEPKLAGARTDCTYALDSGVVGELFTHLRAWQLVGLDPPAGRADVVTSTIRAALQNCVDEVTATCMTMDRTRLSRWTTYVRQLALFGGDLPELDWCHSMNGSFTIQHDQTYSSSYGSGRKSETWVVGFSRDGQQILFGDGVQIYSGAEGTEHVELQGKRKEGPRGCHVVEGTLSGSERLDDSDFLLLISPIRPDEVMLTLNHTLIGVEKWVHVHGDHCENTETQVKNAFIPGWEMSQMDKTWSMDDDSGVVTLAGHHAWSNGAHHVDTTLTGQFSFSPSR